jgi:hypothetical protein
MIIFSALLRYWSGDGSGSHYMIVPEDLAIEPRQTIGAPPPPARGGEV